MSSHIIFCDQHLCPNDPLMRASKRVDCFPTVLPCPDWSPCLVTFVTCFPHSGDFHQWSVSLDCPGTLGGIQDLPVERSWCRALVFYSISLVQHETTYLSWSPSLARNSHTWGTFFLQRPFLGFSFKTFPKLIACGSFTVSFTITSATNLQKSSSHGWRVSLARCTGMNAKVVAGTVGSV